MYTPTHVDIRPELYEYDGCGCLRTDGNRTVIPLIPSDGEPKSWIHEASPELGNHSREW